MDAYLDTIEEILERGEPRNDRTGTGTIAIFGNEKTFYLNKGFPAVTTKKLAWRAVVGELLWFLNGESTIEELKYRTFGDRNADRKTIWSANAEDFYRRNFGEYDPEEDTDLIYVYGPIWRGRAPGFAETDQVQEVIDSLISNPTGRRHIISAWVPDIVHNEKARALPPCHMHVQFYVDNEDRLHAIWYQRSVDVMLGLPFNIASYALLTHIIASICGYGVGTLKFSAGDTHIYKNHIDGAYEQIQRNPLPSPKLILNVPVKSLDDLKNLTAADKPFTLEGYKHHPAIQMEMSV